MGHGKYIDPFASLRVTPSCHADSSCHSERSEESFYQVQAGETLNLQFVVLPGESKDIEVNVELCGPGAEAHLKGLYLCGADEKVRFKVVMHHRAPGCKSTQLFNGIAGGEAEVRFDGTIVVAPDAQQTEAYQENHNIVLTESAKVATKPQLEIYADDVKCSHGATVGQLNQDEIFYMRSRGIPEREAKTLQMISFLSPVIPQGREEEIEKAIRNL
jgi:Fe-S cluster assembly protein SufD